MGKLLMIAVGAALINNVVLSQFLRTVCIPWSFQESGYCGRNGSSRCFRYHHFFSDYRCNLPVSVGAAACGISPDHRIYRSHCSSGAVCGNGH